MIRADEGSGVAYPGMQGRMFRIYETAPKEAATLAALRELWNRRLTDTAFAAKLKVWLPGAPFPLLNVLGGFAASQGWPMPPWRP